MKRQNTQPAEKDQAVAGRETELAAAWEAGEPRRRLSGALVAMRKAAGLSQRALAEAVGWKQPQVARMESATGPWPTREALHDYARACGRTVGLVFVHPRSGHALHIDSAVAFGSGERDQLLDRMADKNVRVSSG